MLFGTNFLFRQLPDQSPPTRAGGAEFAGQENDGQRNFRGWKLQDWK